MTAAPTHRASDLAHRFGLELRGADVEVRGVATLADAAQDQLTFLANPRYRSMLRSCGAGVVVVGEADAAGVDRTLLVAPDPYVAFARVATLFEARTPLRPGIHPSAVVDPDAEVDPGAEVGPQVVIGARSWVASGARLGPGCVVGEDCRIGADCELVARVTLVSRVVIGARVRIHPGAVIGAAGFGLAMDAGQWVNVPQLGGVRIGEDCEIGANTTIDRGALGDTVIEDDVRLDNQIQIGHNVRIGAHTAMAGCSAVAGSARIGRYCLIGGGAGILGHLEICDRVTITAMSLVTRSIAEPGQYSSGVPLQDNRSWRRNAARFKKLDDMARKIDRAAKDTPDP